MKRLSELPNIGKTMEKRLAAVGINDVDTLMKTGSKEAFIKLRLLEGDTCFSSLLMVLRDTVFIPLIKFPG